MADLVIGGATYGMSSKGTEQFIEKIRAEVLTKAGKDLEAKIEEFTKKVDSYWHGQAKDDFCKKIKNDSEKLRKKVEELEKELEEAFQTAQKALEKFDSNLTTEGIKF